MKINFKKISSVLASGVMLGSTIGIAAAAAYPGAFTGSGGNDVAIVVGEFAAPTDYSAALDIGANLNAAITTSAITGGIPDVIGEAYPLFTSSSPLELNKSLSTVHGSITEVDLSTVLAGENFDGDVSADVTFSIIMGSSLASGVGKTVYEKQPTSSDDPVFGVKIGTTAANYLYNATVSFNKAVNFTHADSEGEDLILFGEKFTVSSETSTSKLVLLKSSETIALSSDVNPVETITVDGETYTIELVGSTDLTSRIRVTDSSGKTTTKTLTAGGSSKTMVGLDVAVTYSNEDTATNRLQAEVIVGANKVTLTDGNEVQVGTDNKPLDGTQVSFTPAGSYGAVTKITFQVFAGSGSDDAILPGQAFVDPVFGSFKVDFAGLTIGEDDREEISITKSGNDKMSIGFSNWQGESINSFEWLNNESYSGASSMLADSDQWRIIVQEMGTINESAFTVVGNEDEGYLISVSSISNSSSSTPSDDSVTFENVFDTSQTWDTVITDTEGQGTVSIGGKTYDVYYYDDRDGDNDEHVRLDYPDSTNDMILYPTIETSKGAKLFFYEPLTIELGNWDGRSNSLSGNNFKFPDGKGYTDLALVGGAANNWTIGGSGHLNTTVTTAGASSITATIGQLTYNFTNTGTIADNKTIIYLQDNGVNILNPAIVIFEEEDEAGLYHAVIIRTGGGGDSNNGVGVVDVDFTWNSDNDMSGSAYGASGLQSESDDDLYSMADSWGTVVTTDQGTSDQYTAVISYPDEQVQSQVFIAASDASIGTQSGGNVVPVYDNEVSMISGKNLIVVGGSCINTIAAELLDSPGTPLCGADFTARTTVGSGQYMIETFTRSGKLATLVAGYNAVDTTSASIALTTRTVDITSGTKYIGDNSGSFAMM